MEKKNRLHRKFEVAYNPSKDARSRMAALLAIIRATNAAITPQECTEVMNMIGRRQGTLAIVSLFPALVSSDFFGRPLPAVLEFLAKMGISAVPGRMGDSEKALIVMVLAGLDSHSYATCATSAFSQASPDTHRLLKDLVWYCDDVIKRDATMAIPPVNSPHYARLVKEQLVSHSAMATWDLYLPKLVREADPVSLSMMELAMYFHSFCLAKLPQGADSRDWSKELVHQPKVFLELSRRTRALAERTILKDTPKQNIHACLAYLNKHSHLSATLGHIGDVHEDFRVFDRQTFIFDVIPLVWGDREPATMDHWELNRLESFNLDVIVELAYHTLRNIVLESEERLPPGTVLSGTSKPCSAACRLRHPEKHVQCVASLLHKFLRLRPILPNFLLETVKRWQNDGLHLFKDMPQEPPDYRDAVFRRIFPDEEHPGRELADYMLSYPAMFGAGDCARDLDMMLPKPPPTGLPKGPPPQRTQLALPPPAMAEPTPPGKTSTMPSEVDEAKAAEQKQRRAAKKLKQAEKRKQLKDSKESEAAAISAEPPAGSRQSPTQQLTAKTASLALEEPAQQVALLDEPSTAVTIQAKPGGLDFLGPILGTAETGNSMAASAPEQELQPQEVAAPKSLTPPPDAAADTSGFTEVTRKSGRRKKSKAGAHKVPFDSTPAPAPTKPQGCSSTSRKQQQRPTPPPEFAPFAPGEEPAARELLAVSTTAGVGDGGAAGKWSYQQYCQIPDEVEDLICCPISQEVMADAVRAEDGQTYSLAAIQGWFDTGKRTSPMTNLEMGTKLLPNEAIRQMVRDELDRQATLA